MAKNSGGRPTVSPRRSNRQSEGYFSTFDGKQIAVILQQDDKRYVFRGTAHLAREDKLGIVLKIVSAESEPGQPELIIPEKGWSGRVIPDLEYGCEFCMIPG